MKFVWLEAGFDRHLHKSAEPEALERLLADLAAAQGRATNSDEQDRCFASAS
jgi:hypothetical protein